VRLAGIYTGRILKATRQSELPVPQVDQGRADHQPQDRKVIGLTVPPPLIALCRRGDRMKLLLRCMSLEVAQTRSATRL
jgi:hypothetical protein